MKNFTEIKVSLQSNKPDDVLSVQLRSLWYDGKGDLQRAHALVDQLSDESSAWVHAYLHRKKGDTWNADYWYRKAKRIRPDISLQEEWEQLAVQFLG